MKMEPQYKTLCWKCKNACCGCDWSKHYREIEGWNAIPTKLKVNHGFIKSYQVIECPQFISD